MILTETLKLAEKKILNFIYKMEKGSLAAERTPGNLLEFLIQTSHEISSRILSIFT